MGIKTFYVANPTVKQVEVYTDFTGGLNTEQADNKMRDNQFRELVNFDFDKAGSLTKRPGLKKIAKLNDAMYVALLKVFLIEELVDLEVIDTQQFFDGLNWVFNYITNKGLCVAILNKNLEVEVDVDGNILKQDKNFRFYPDIKDNIKISSYSDYYVMMTSKYETNTVVQDKTRQVKLYSWNPIPDLEYETSDKDVDGNPIIMKYDKQWVEASVSQEENPSATYYGDTITETTSSTNKLPVPTGVNTLNIKVTPYDNSRVMFSALLRFDMTISYRFQTGGVNPSLEFRWTNRSSTGSLEPRVYEVPINLIGKIIIDEDIHQMTSDIDSYSMNFAFYIPSVSTIINFVLPIPTTGNTLDVAKNIVKTIYTKKAFKKIKNINSGSQRARNFLLSKEGVPCEILRSDVYTQDGNESIIGGIDFYSSKYLNNPSDIDKIAFNFALDFSQNNFNPTDTKYSGISYRKNSYSDSINYTDTITKATAINLIDYTNTGNNLREGKGIIAPYDNDGVEQQALMYPSHPIIDSVVYTGFISSLGKTQNPFWNISEYAKITDNSIPSWFGGNFMIHNVSDDNLVYSGNYFVDNSPIALQKTLYSPQIEGADYNKSSIIFPDNNDKLQITLTNAPITYGMVGYSLFQWRQNIVTNHKHSDYISGTNSRGFAFGQGSAIITSGSKVYNLENFYFAGLQGNNLDIFNPNKPENWINGLLLNDKFDLIKDASVVYGWRPFLGEDGYQQLKVLALLRQQGKVVSLKLSHTVTKADGTKIILQSLLRQNQLFSLLDFIIGDENSLLTVFFVQEDSVTSLDYKIYSGFFQETLIFDIKDYSELKQEDYKSVANSLTFSFVYNYFENEASNSVVQFKKSVYQKPNLNDLKYIYYNFALFSKHWDKTNPNIYSQSIYPSLSTNILEYPQKPDKDSLGIQGIVPINNLILLPGDKQRFQVLASFGGNSLTDIVCNVTVMKINDFIARNADDTFSTEDSLKWVDWATQFPGATATDPNSSILIVDIPSSTEPYIISVSIARLGVEVEGVRKIDTKTLRESQIEMSPQSSINQRIDIPSLFDEFTSTTNMGIMETASALVAYGNSNKLFFSDIATPSYFPVSAIVPLKTPQSITSITMFQNKLIVSTANTRSYISGTSFDAIEPENRISVKEISSNSGTISPKAEIPFGDRLYFIDSNGVKYLQNLYGTSDKEFTYKQADALIKSIVPVYDTQACAVSYDEKLYVNFPSEKIMLVYHKNFDAWIMYESEFMAFANMFVNEGKLYAVSKNTFDIYSFDRDVMVDSWNEDIGYEVWEAPDGTKHNVQKGKPIRCSLQTKDLDQNYNPHQKKYKELLINATVTGTNGTIAPIIEVDSDQINYKFDYVLDGTNTLSYRELEPDVINLQSSSNINYDPKISNGSVSLSNMVVGNSILGNTKEVNYMLPIRRKGNVVSFNLVFDAPSLIMINSFSLIYSLAKIKKNRGGR